MVTKNTINNNNGCTQSTKAYPNSSDQKTKDFIKSVGGSEAELVIEKRLTVSDVSGNLGRLLIPVKNPGFLTGEEKAILGEKQNVSVLVFDPERRKVALNLGKWKMSKEYYVLKTNWNQVVCTNGLKEEMVIRVLLFRDVQQKLCFAIDRVA
ncbi:B3 domain-containing protein At2g32645-like [Bidens hawaiensis]|uniref:B3 domain-containing protein At2g32645-like n=1 Tax=Bidens hawaiensis TaxID=980011 RepID=UPI004049CF3A